MSRNRNHPTIKKNQYYLFQMLGLVSFEQEVPEQNVMK